MEVDLIVGRLSEFAGKQGATKRGDHASHTLHRAKTSEHERRVESLRTESPHANRVLGRVGHRRGGPIKPPSGIREHGDETESRG